MDLPSAAANGSRRTRAAPVPVTSAAFTGVTLSGCRYLTLIKAEICTDDVWDP